MANTKSSYCHHRRNAGYHGSARLPLHWVAVRSSCRAPRRVMSHRVGCRPCLCSEGHPCKRAEPNGHLGVSCR